MDILQINKKISEWQDDLSKHDNYKIIKTIKEVISFYSQLDKKQRDLFLNNFKPIRKKIFDNIYSSDSLVRKYVVNLAMILNTNELVLDVIKYLKIEKDYDNIMVYLDYIDKFKVVGFVDYLFDFLKQTEMPLSLKFRTFAIILPLLTNHNSNSIILSYIFDEIHKIIKNHENFRYSLLSMLYKSLIESSMIYYSGQDSPKVISIFVDFYGSLLFKTIELIRYFYVFVDDEDKSESLASCTIFVVLIKLLLDKLEYKPDSTNLRDNVTSRWFQFDLHSFFTEVFKNIKSKEYFLSFILSSLKKYGLQEDFCRLFTDGKEFINMLIDHLDPNKPRLCFQILNFLLELGLSLSKDNLKNISNFCKNILLDESIILLCLDIFDKNSHYEDILYFARYKSSLSEKARLKIKSMIQKMVRNKSDDVD